MQDYYQILGLERDSSEKDIKRAYRRKLFDFHPDKKGKSEENTHMMALLNEAYETLIDPQKRENFNKNFEYCCDEEIGDEKKFHPAGYLGTSGVPHSEVFKKQHAELVNQFRQNPLNSEPAISHFKSFESKIYQWENKTYDDIFSFLKREADVSAPVLKFDQPITPADSVKLFIDFLRGNIWGENSIRLRQYFASEIKIIKMVDEYFPTIRLYEGMHEIISMDEIKAGNESALLFSIKKITDYAKENPLLYMPFLAPLFQNKYFRNLFAQAIHLHWQHSKEALHQKNLEAFNGREETWFLLNGLKTQLINSNVSQNRQKNLKDLIQEIQVLYYFEKELHKTADEKQSAKHYRKKAFDILDWFPAFAGKVTQQMTANLFIQAGTYFQRASLHAEETAVQIADEKMALNMYVTAFVIGHHATPDVELYTYIQSLRYMSLFRFQHADLSDIISAFQHRASVLADIYPFFQPIRNNLDLLMQGERSIILMRQFLHELVAVIEKNKKGVPDAAIDHRHTTVLYQAYEACLKNWYEEKYEEKTEQKVRLDLMRELLFEKKWTFTDLRKNLVFPQFTQRDSEGWMQPSRALPLIKIESMAEPIYINSSSASSSSSSSFISSTSSTSSASQFRALDGVELNYKMGTVKFSFKNWDEKRPTYEKTLTIFDLDELLQKNIVGAIFSLDPVDPDMPYHPFNKMRFVPAALYETQLFQVMLLTDYFLKFFTTGQEVQGQYPYSMRSLNQLVNHLPAYLRKIIEDYQQAPRYEESMHRFWIEAEEMPMAFGEEMLQQDGTQTIALGKIRMRVKKHKMERTPEGDLVDAEEKDEGWPVYILTSQQINSLKCEEHKIPTPAMIFEEGDIRHVYFLEDEKLSPAIELKGCEESLTRLYKRERDDKNKMKSNFDNDRLKYRLVKKVALQTGKSHRFSPEYIFAQEFTSHYDEFAQYFPEFGRLRELGKITTLVHIIKDLQIANEKNIEELEKKLSYEEHWGEYESKEQKVTRPETKYQDDCKREHKRICGILTSNFDEWRGKFSKQELLSKKLENLSETRRRIGKLTFYSYSSEVQEAYDNRYERVKNDVISRYGYDVWYNQSHEITSQISKHDIAEKMTNLKRTDCREQLHKIFASPLSHLSWYRRNDLIQEFMDGDSEPLAQELAELDYSEAKERIRKIVDQSMFEVEAALEGDAEAVPRMATQTMKKSIQKQLPGRKKLSSQFRRTGLNKEEKKVTHTGTCFWVPASVKHETGEKARFVYGGVNIQPDLHIVEPGSAEHGHLIEAAFSNSNHCSVDIAEVGQKVYRVWGDDSGPYGRCWTRTNPGEVEDYRNEAGLPNKNTGRFVSEGRLKDTTGVETRAALPLDGNKGGLDEIQVPDPETQINLERVSGVNPEF